MHDLFHLLTSRRTRMQYLFCFVPTAEEIVIRIETKMELTLFLEVLSRVLWNLWLFVMDATKTLQSENLGINDCFVHNSFSITTIRDRLKFYHFMYWIWIYSYLLTFASIATLSLLLMVFIYSKLLSNVLLKIYWNYDGCK